MIKAITKRYVKKGQEKQYIQMIKSTHPLAKQQPGYIVAEPLISVEDKSVFMVVSTWESLEHWKAWIASDVGRDLYRKTAPLLRQEPETTIYEIIDLYE